MHLGCALVSQHRFQVDHVSDNRVFQRYPVAAQYCSGCPADFDRLTGVVQFAEADLLGMALVGMGQVSARYWLSTGREIPKDAAEQLIARLAWRGISDWPMATEAPGSF